MTFAPANAQGAFLSTSEVFPQDPEQLLVKLTEVYSNLAHSSNAKDIALYDLMQIVTGQQWFVGGDPNRKRSAFRKVFSIGAVGVGATLTTAHAISGMVIFTRLYGGAITGVIDFRPIPYVSATTITDQIGLRCDSTNIIIVNGATAPAISSAVVVLEYLLN